MSNKLEEIGMAKRDSLVSKNYYNSESDAK